MFRIKDLIVSVKNSDNYAVIIKHAGGSMVLGYKTLTDCVSLVENQIEQSDASKMQAAIQEAINPESTGVTVEGVTYNVIDAITYFDLYEEDDSEV